MAGCGGRSRRSGQAPMGGGLLPPVIAPAVGARGRLRDRNADRPDSDGPPLRGPTPELEPVDRDAIRVVATLSSRIYDRVSYQD